MTAPCCRLARLPPRRRLRLRLVPFPPPLLLLLLAAAGPARGWESGDLELFDLVEEVQLNFYQFLGVQQVSGAGRPAASPPEGCASGAEKCGYGRKGGGADSDPVSSEGAGHAGQDLVILGSSAVLSPIHQGLLVTSLRGNDPPSPIPHRPAPLLEFQSQ